MPKIVVNKLKIDPGPQRSRTIDAESGAAPWRSCVAPQDRRRPGAAEDVHPKRKISCPAAKAWS